MHASVGFEHGMVMSVIERGICSGQGEQVSALHPPPCYSPSSFTIYSTARFVMRGMHLPHGQYSVPLSRYFGNSCSHSFANSGEQSSEPDLTSIVLPAAIAATIGWIVSWSVRASGVEFTLRVHQLKPPSLRSQRVWHRCVKNKDR